MLKTFFDFCSGIGAGSLMKEKLDEFNKKLISEFWMNGKSLVET